MTQIFESIKTCRNTKYIQRFPNRPDLPQCVATGEKSNDLRLYKVPDAKYKDPGIPNQIVYSQCHHECKTTCDGLTEYDCQG